MTIDIGYPNGCSEEFAELCAISTSGELSAEEWVTLNQHIAGCAPCATLLREYANLSYVGMTKLAAEHAANAEIDLPLGYDETKAELRFIAAFRARRSRMLPREKPDLQLGRWQGMQHPALLTAAAAVLLFCIGGAFELGRRMAVVPSHSASVSPSLARLQAGPDGKNAQLRMELAAAQQSLKVTTEKSASSERQLAALSDTQKSLLSQIEQLTRKDDGDSSSLATVTQQRDALQQQVSDTSSALTKAREELSHAQQDRQGALFRIATLETEIQGLHTQLASTDNTAENEEKFLAADRDVRELMGARQLYIADVFDVKNDGVRSKPFGRVFYTKGKSLIFYAFDLEKQPGYREAKAFQAWGKPDGSSARPISIGIFYMDSEQSRRWVVKSDNPELLAQINSVFVTVEPHGGSQTPTGKPFLEAYLHTLPPNHP
jgi:hypothetical protein